MDKLEQYLDRVCRGLGGTRAMRLHVRQELREHLLDAAAEHKAAGLDDAAALDRAIEDFGGPEQVRSELEQTHGHRVLAAIVDTAMQWKELTMKSKMLWTAWAHVVLLLIVAGQILFIVGQVVFIVPKQFQLFQDGTLGASGPDTHDVISWAMNFLHGLIAVADNWQFWAIPLAIVWILCEWRIRGDYKPFLRLSALGSAAVGLVVTAALTSAAIILPLILTVPAVATRPPEPIVANADAGFSAAINAAFDRLNAGDTDGALAHIHHASRSISMLLQNGGAAPAIVASSQQPRVDAVRASIKSVHESLNLAMRALYDKDPAKAAAALRQAQQAYEPARPTTRPN